MQESDWIWNVGQPLGACPESDADGPTRWWWQGEAETHYVAPSLKRGWERGIWRIPHSLQRHPTLLQTQDCVRTSMLWPVLALYLRVPAPNIPIHQILIGVESGTHDQLTGGDIDGRATRDSRSTRSTSAPQSSLSWRIESRRMPALLGIVGHASCTQA